MLGFIISLINSDGDQGVHADLNVFGLELMNVALNSGGPGSLICCRIKNSWSLKKNMVVTYSDEMAGFPAPGSDAQPVATHIASQPGGQHATDQTL